jgi:hypothetical protein
MIGGKDGSNFSSAHGATEYGLIFRPLRSNVTGPRCPPFSVTKASTSLEASRHESWPRTNCFAPAVLDLDFMAAG